MDKQPATTSTESPNKITIHAIDIPDNLELGDSIAIDTETMGLNVKRDRLCTVQISDIYGNVHIVMYLPDNYKSPNLVKILNNKNIQKIFHFAMFDVPYLNHWLGSDIKNIYCTKVASKLARTYSEAHTLKALCKELLKIDLPKLYATSNWGAKGLTQEQINYAATDVIHLHRLRDKLNIMLKRESRYSLATNCMSIIPGIVKLKLAEFSLPKVIGY